MQILNILSQIQSIVFQDARHEKGFTATSADLLWIIEQVNQKAQNVEETQSQADETFLPEIW